MKKASWVFIPIILIIVIVGYVYITKYYNRGEISYIDGIPTSTASESDATQASSNDFDKIGQPDESVPSAAKQSSGSSAPENIDKQAQGNTSEPNNQDAEQDLPSTRGVPGNTTSNLANGGVFATDGICDYIILQNSFGHSKLIKINKKAGKYEEVTNTNGYSMNIVDNWIYFLIRNEGIFRIKTDGTQLEKLYGGFIVNLVIVDDSMYFVNADELKIYSMKTDGSNLKLLFDETAFNIQYNDGYLYFNHHSDTVDLYRVRLTDFSDKQKIAENVEKYIVHEDSIYFLKYDDSRRLHKIILGQSESKIITADIDKVFFIENGRIYFTVSEEKGRIYSMDLDGKNIAVLPEGKYKPIRNISAVIGDIVYYKVIFDESEAGMDKLAIINSDGSINELITDEIGD